MAENRVQKQAYTYMDSYVLTKLLRKFGGEWLIFSTNGTGTTEHPCLKKKTIMKKKKKTRHNLTPSTKINLKYIIDLNKKL